MRKTVLMVCGTAVFVGLLTGTANATPAENDGCPFGFQSVTFEQLEATQEVQAAYADGIYGRDHIETAFAAGNKNGDEFVCYKPVANEDNVHVMVYYAGRYMDNNAGPKE